MNKKMAGWLALSESISRLIVSFKQKTKIKKGKFTKKTKQSRKAQTEQF